ncbi:MAG: MopE-related protein, partial [Myxococcota bacterium]
MLLLVACATPDTPALTARAKAVSCPTGCACEADGDRDYAFCTTAASEPDAQSACEAAGMTLADVEDATENTWLWARAESHHAASNWWLGLSDVATEGTWAWESGSTSTYTNWRTGEPNDYGGAEDCVIWKDDGGGGWNDKSCADRLPYVCEAGCLYLDWFADADGDGFGDPAALARACDAPGGYVADASDCDDADATVAPTRTFYADADGDGFGSAPTEACDAPSGHVETGGDCDDADPAAYPGAPETSLDGVDQDCDGADACTWYRDADGDGHGVAGDTTEDCAGAPSGYAATADDCDDADATVSPSASEVWYDGVDQDCDGNDDDADGDGVAVSTDCDDGDASEFPDAPEACDAEDDDCDGVLDDGAPCPGTTGAYDDHAYVFVTTDASWAAAAAACDAIGYHLVELADAAEDDWVAGEAYALEGTGWWIGLSDVATEGTFVWQESAATYTDWRAGEPNDYGGNEDCGAYATSGGQWNDKDCAQALPYVCEAGCEKATWYTDADGDGYGSAATRACTQPSGTVAIAGDCDDADAGVSPLRVETCDGADEDCDGEADEDATDAPTWYLDADGDGYGTDALAACSQPDGYAAAGDDCDDGDPVVYPGAPELDDGLDDD